MSVQTYVSSGTEYSFLPLLDVAADIVSRDSRWRRALLAQVAPLDQDIILELGGRDGAFAQAMAAAAPGADIIFADRDGAVRAHVRERADRARVSFSVGAWSGAALQTPPTKVVANLVRHDLSSADKREVLLAARAAISTGGRLYVADFTPSRAALFTRLVGAVRPSGNAAQTGALAGAIRAAGFEAVEETTRLPTASGSISLYRARAA